MTVYLLILTIFITAHDGKPEEAKVVVMRAPSADACEAGLPLIAQQAAAQPGVSDVQGGCFAVKNPKDGHA